MFSLASSENKSVNAKEWCDSCIAALGKGRGGGKADLANANFPVDDSQNANSVIAALLSAANTYVVGK